MCALRGGSNQGPLGPGAWPIEASVGKRLAPPPACYGGVSRHTSAPECRFHLYHYSATRLNFWIKLLNDGELAVLDGIGASPWYQ